MNVIVVNGRQISPIDLCLMPNVSHEDLIEYWQIHEIDDELPREESDALNKVITEFARSGFATSLTIRTSNGRYQIEKSFER